MTMKTAWRMLGLDWVRLISDYFGFSGYHFPLCSSKLCVDHHTPCHILYTRRPETGRERSLIGPQSQILTFGRFGALYNTLSLIA